MSRTNSRGRATREEIALAAGRLFRANGISDTGIDAVMSAVGLTPGGFYNHFRSKQALLAEVVTRSIKESCEKLTAGMSNLSRDVWVKEFLRRYLARTHRDAPEEGCPVAALATELPHYDEMPSVLAREVENYLHMLEGALDEQGKVTARQRAYALFAMCVGGIVLSRAMRGTKVSDEILEACRAVGGASPH